MKLQLLLVAVFALAAISIGYTQPSDRKWTIGLGLGAAIPMGDITSTDVKDQDAGYAKTGYLADLNFSYRFSSKVGAMLLVRNQSFLTDNRALSDDLQPVIPADYNAKINATPWSTSAVMVGPYVSIPVGDKLFLEARGLAGIGVTTLPEVKMTFGGSEVTAGTDAADALAWLVGTGMKYNLTKRIGLGAHVDYFSATPEFTSPDEKGKFDVAVKAVNATLSIGYMF